ncbi:hypothetical protein RKD21_000158 [Streptomyces albogriseolus]|uniref:Uncharacterized protein n=1 Tax=Streptomyces albogriseolus TaxID=1887 RepID=A0ACC6UEZ6_STRAO
MAVPSTRRHGPLRPHTVPRCSAGLPSTSDSRRSPRPAAVGSPPRAPSRRRTAGPAERAEPDRDLPDRPPRDPAPHRPYRAWQARRTSDRPGSPRPPPQAPRPAPSPHGTAGPPSMSDRPRPPRPATAAPRPAPSPHGTAGPPSTSDRRPSPRRAARHPCARAPPRRATTGPPSASSPAARRRNGGGPPGRSPWVSRSRAAPAVCGRRVGGPCAWVLCDEYRPRGVPAAVTRWCRVAGFRVVREPRIPEAAGGFRFRVSGRPPPPLSESTVSFRDSTTCSSMPVGG